MLTTMKRPISLTSPLAITAISAISVVLLLVLSGCGTLTGPPKPWEQKYYDVQTNTIEMVNWYTNWVTVTNFEVVLIEKPVQSTVDPSVYNYITVTNIVPVMEYKTNVVSLTNLTEQYVFTPNDTAKTEIVGTATDIGGYFGAGNVVGLIAGALVGLWGVIRSKKAQSVAATLAQVIEVGSEIIKSNPATAGLDAKWKTWMQQHQAETGTLNAVLNILKNNTDNRDAKDVANALLKLTT